MILPRARCGTTTEATARISVPGMGTGVHPRGRRPAAVYWRRRIVLLAVVVVVASLGWRWVGDDEPAESAKSSRPVASPSTSTPDQDVATSTPAGRQPAHKPAAKKKPARPAKRISTELRAPRGGCDVADVVVVPDVADAEIGGPVPLRLGLSSTEGRACTLQLNDKLLALQVTSGEDLIWRSSSCPDVLDAQSVTLRPGWLSYVEVAWSGRRGSETCLASNEFAEPGYYWAEAALIGGEPSRGQFRLESPPPPSKKPQQPKTPTKPKKQTSDDEADQT